MRLRFLLLLALSAPAWAQPDEGEDKPAAEAPSKPEKAAAPAKADEAPPEGAAADQTQAEDSPPEPAPKRRPKPAHPRPAEPEPTAEPAQKDPAAVPPPPPAALDSAARPTEKAMTDKAAAMETARTFFKTLLAGDVNDAVAVSLIPFQLEGRKFTNADDLLTAFSKALRQNRVDLLTLYGIQIYTPQEMEKAFGKPPPRLASFPYKDGRTMLAVANLSGHAAVVILKWNGAGYLASGYTD